SPADGEDAFAARHPKQAVIVFGDAVDDVVEQAIVNRKAENAIAINQAKTLAKRAHPQQAVAVPVESDGATQRGRIKIWRRDDLPAALVPEREDRLGGLAAWIDGALNAAISIHRRTSGSRNPQRAGGVAKERANIVSWQPLHNGPRPGDATMLHAVQAGIGSDPEIAVSVFGERGD